MHAQIDTTHLSAWAAVLPRRWYFGLVVDLEDNPGWIDVGFRLGPFALGFAVRWRNGA